MLNETQTAVAIAAVCLLAVALLVLGRRRRRTDGETSSARGSEPGTLVLARTHDGTQYQGALADPNGATVLDGALVLAGPIVFRRAGGKPEVMPPAWDRLTLQRTDLAEVWTRSHPVADGAGTATSAAAAHLDPTLASSPPDAAGRGREDLPDAAEDSASGTRRRHARRERRAAPTTS